MMSAQHTPARQLARGLVDAGVELSLRIGQRVRHCNDFKGRRVIGVIRALSLSEDVLHAEIGLDEPLVIDALSPEDRAIHLYRQNVPAHELTPFDERDEVISQLLQALDEARNGLLWYRDRNPGQSDGSDDEAMERIDAAIAKASTTPPHGWTAAEEAAFQAYAHRVFEREQAAKATGGAS